MINLRNKLHSWCYLGYDKNTLEKYEDQLAKENLHVFSYVLPVAAIITVAELVFTYLFAVSGEGVTHRLLLRLRPMTHQIWCSGLSCCLFRGAFLQH